MPDRMRMAGLSNRAGGQDDLACRDNLAIDDLDADGAFCLRKTTLSTSASPLIVRLGASADRGP